MPDPYINFQIRVCIARQTGLCTPARTLRVQLYYILDLTVNLPRRVQDLTLRAGRDAREKVQAYFSQRSLMRGRARTKKANMWHTIRVACGSRFFIKVKHKSPKNTQFQRAPRERISLILSPWVYRARRARVSKLWYLNHVCRAKLGTRKSDKL